MTEPSENQATARCACGRVELQTIGDPILSSACHCDDCQTGARQIEGLPEAPPVLDAEGGSDYLLYRKDRMQCTKGLELLKDYRLNEESPTKRVVASCCNAAMYLDFSKGHWYSMYRSRFVGKVPDLQMRVQTKFMKQDLNHTDNVPRYSGYPLRFFWKLVVAQVAMILSR